MIDAVIPGPTFDWINRNAQVYPAHLLPAGGTALSLFSAGFYGHNDVIHMARKEMEIDCVDVDQDKLWHMAQTYPNVMTFHVKDAWEFAAGAIGEGRTWDAVSVDPFMGDAAEKAWGTMWLWGSLATKLLTVTIDPKQPPWTPGGWESYVFPRSSRAAWMVLTRA